MTAATIHRPTRTELTTGLAPEPTTRLPFQRGGPSARRPELRLDLRLVPPTTPTALHAPAARRGSTGAVHLTRRGRLVVLLILVAAGVAVMMALTGLVGGAAAGTAPARPATRTIVVQPGQTLWSIAGTVAPNVDRRDTIARIVELNALPNTAVSAGARIAVPAP